MSKPIPIGRFCLFFCLYGVISLLIHSATGFTILAWLVYLITLLPLYLICLAHVISLWLRHRQSTIQHRKFLIYPIAMTQLLVILATPSNCYGFKQGRACYSLLQALWVGDGLNNFGNTTPHWSLIEDLFPVALVLYAIFLGVFLAKLRIRPTSLLD